MKALVTGLAAAQICHYRLVTVTSTGKTTVGADTVLVTLPRERLHPAKVEMSASPQFQHTMPDRVTVSGRMVPPAGLNSLAACRGYFDITFRVRQIAVQSLRAGIHNDCTFQSSGRVPRPAAPDGRSRHRPRPVRRQSCTRSSAAQAPGTNDSPATALFGARIFGTGALGMM